MNELENCPFCGTPNPSIWKCECRRGSVSVGGYDSRGGAARAWNRRPRSEDDGDDPQVAYIAEIEAENERLRGTLDSDADQALDAWDDENDAAARVQRLRAEVERINALYEAVVALYSVLEIRNWCPACQGEGRLWVHIGGDNVDTESCECYEMARDVLVQYGEQYQSAVDGYLRAEGHDPGNVSRHSSDLAAMILADVS